MEKLIRARCSGVVFEQSLRWSLHVQVVSREKEDLPFEVRKLHRFNSDQFVLGTFGYHFLLPHLVQFTPENFLRSIKSLLSADKAKPDLTSPVSRNALFVLIKNIAW